MAHLIAKTVPADTLLEIPKCNGAERAQEILEEETGLEQDKCMEPAQTHQLSTAPSEVKEISKEAEKRQEIKEEEKSFEQGKCVEMAEIHPSSTAPSKVIIDGDQFMKFMTEHHKQQQKFQDKIFTNLLDQLTHHHTRQEQNQQQQSKVYEQFLQQQQDFQSRLMGEFQDKIFTTLLDQLKHQHTQQEQNQQRQSKVYEQFYQQQQDFQSRLMGEFMKHTEIQNALFSQVLSNVAGKAEQPVHDDHPVNVDEKPQDAAYNQPSNSERTYTSSAGHNSIFGRDPAEKSPSFGHFEVANRDRQASQVFDCHTLGLEFCKWFYSRLNSQNPAHGQERIAWEPDMFWNDARFLFAHENSYEEYIGGECVSEKLLEITQQQKLTFTAELDSDRFRCVNSRHGLVMVAVTGVIYKNDHYLGIFRQIFGLIKCPSTGRYKIKNINLRLHSTSQYVPLTQYSTEELQDFKIQHAHQYL